MQDDKISNFCLKISSKKETQQLRISSELLELIKQFCDLENLSAKDYSNYILAKGFYEDIENYHQEYLEVLTERIK